MLARTLFLAAIAALLASCSGGPVASPPPTGGTAVVAWQEPATLDLFYASGAQSAATIARVAVEGLVAISPEGTELPVLAREVPTLANGAVTVSPDGKAMTVRYQLRDGVKWSDGAPFTSADVRFTWRTIMTDPKISSRDGYDRIDDVETPDALTAIVRYRALDPAYATRFDAILPQHLLENAADSVRVAYGRAPLGTGPFRITEFAAGDHVTAERNANARSRPLLDRVIFRFTPSLDVAKAQLKAGEADLAPSIFESDVPDLASEATIAIAQAPSPIVETVLFNFAKPSDAGADPAQPHPILADRAVRHALAIATPKQRIVDTLLYGRARAGTSEVPIGWAAYGLVQDGYDPAAAKRELDGAGWIAGADGIRSRDGVRASLRLVGTTGNALRERIEQVLVEALQVREHPDGRQRWHWGELRALVRRRCRQGDLRCRAHAGSRAAAQPSRRRAHVDRRAGHGHLGVRPRPDRRVPHAAARHQEQRLGPGHLERRGVVARRKVTGARH